VRTLSKTNRPCDFDEAFRGGRPGADSLSDYPNNPTSTGTALSENCAIPLGKVGSTTDITVPFTDGGRVWFSIGDTLTFLLNPGESGAELVEPSVTNTSDPNYNLTWDFCEFSLGTAGLYVNITYVDFVCIPIALTLTNTSGTVTHVSGLPSDGLETICNELVAQNNKDNAGWDKLIVKKSDGSTLRVLNPTGGIDFDSTLFKDYWTDYVNQAWNKYVSASLEIDTQSSWGVVDGNTSNDRNSITFSGVGSFSKPSAADIFSQSTGAFAPQASNTDELLNIGARLSTAINRSTLLTDPDQPDAETVSSYYQNSVTNHFARIVHAANLDGKGYCFPYDDVGGANEEDQSGRLTDPSPSNLLITVGGGNASSKLKRGLVEAEKPKMKRSLAWNEDVKEPLPQAADYRDLEKAQVADYRDLEKGEHPKLMNELARANEAPKAIVPPILKRALGRYWTVSFTQPICL